MTKDIAACNKMEEAEKAITFKLHSMNRNLRSWTIAEAFLERMQKKMSSISVTQQDTTHMQPDDDSALTV